ncbi:putative thioredoxin-like protein [Rosa chinensis]|uniref:Putative thioredoxin-like protein n=1 Tax=Rosa chinensis TaxID=74649 RepID=A0A2P6RTG7_ROSCH|nr:putative thioredoxin-like protein [Rosa chinensis]
MLLFFFFFFFSFHKLLTIPTPKSPLSCSSPTSQKGRHQPPCLSHLHHLWFSPYHRPPSSFIPIIIHQSPQSGPTPDKSSSFSPDSVINTWELMDGLNDESHSPSFAQKPQSSVKFIGAQKKPLWQHLSEESLLAKMDPNVVSTYRRALSSSKLRTTLPFKSRPLNCSTSSSPAPVNSNSNACFLLPGSEDKIVVYSTSLRGIRKTYEDCCAVRMIFRGLRVAVDERDISMDSQYKKELQNAVRGKAPVRLPQVFVRGNYIGGAEEVKQLNELGELALLLKGFPSASAFGCDGCGDVRFVPCTTCNGSQKLFDENKGELRRCPHCNENGLIRCSACCL